ncbi:MAG: hemerythrin domain-containing protein [Candidatus Heimdallarchaeota archaeon]|nr:hemerythrin domain-containing protein [Candidatus Heimdallarchaeota archaeon]
MEIRFDPLGPSHKAIRNAINHVNFKAWNVDFEDDEALDAFIKEFEMLYKLLHAHAKGEDDFLFPLIKKVDEEIFEDLENDHKVIDPQMEDIENELFSIRKMSAEERYGPSLSFVKKFNTLVADYYIHLQNEEFNGVELLWENYTDKELQDAVTKFATVTPPEASMYYAKFFFPAVNRRERIGYLLGLKANAPSEIYERFVKIAQETLSEKDWKVIFKALN